ncbi:MAG: T9SS type A sorting domain-containing protein [Paludibacteraceae bacterium]|nr:T9SS type A sorting domain-containing protein [Paludibacteraceae bacterium]
MRSITKYLFTLLGALSLTLSARAQVYSCDFEDPAERAQWHLNPGNQGPMCVNKWYIGAPGHHAPTGSNGLYVSMDGTSNNYSTTNTMFVVAYRELTLPVGTYILSYDWNMSGQSGDCLYSGWVPVTTATNSAASTGGTPPWCATGADTRIDSLQGAQLWSVHNNTFTSDGTPHKLVFLWFNKQGTPMPPAACVDNIEIFRVDQAGQGGYCEAPTDIKHTPNADGSLTLSWSGNASSYDVLSYDLQTQQWQILSNQTTNSVIINSLSEGVQSFKVRANCGNGSVSNYVGYNSFVWLKGQRCIDFLDLDAATCSTGGRVGKVDYGFNRVESHHTLHYMPKEYDPRTEGLLKVVPDGEIASVRIGNWLKNDTTDVIEYNYHIPSGAGEILKIKYALVFELPDSHDSLQMPRMLFEIRDRRTGRQLSQCTEASFSAGFGVTRGKWTTTADRVTWLDWTELAISLRDYPNQDIIIHLEMHDCSLMGHYGYGYFVIDCESGGLHGLNCMEPTTHFEAPSGFDYRWYRASEPQITLGTGQSFDNEGPMDTVLYLCDVISRNNKRCWYTLEASGIPRYPVPTTTWTREQCSNTYVFDNTSHVMTINQESGDTVHTVSSVDSLLWDFGDGSTALYSKAPQVRHEYPLTGGRFEAKLTAVIDYCSITQTYMIDVPDLSKHAREVRDIHICDGESYTFNGRTYFNSYTDSVLTTSRVTGCDSTCVLILTVHDTTALQVYDTICASDGYMFNGEVLRASGKYKAWLKNVYDCDSVVDLNLTAYDWVYGGVRGIQLSPVPNICYGDASFTLQCIMPEISDSIWVNYNDSMLFYGATNFVLANPGGPFDLDIPLGNAGPGYYSVTISGYNDYCGVISTQVNFIIRFPSSVLAQKWNDAIGVLNSNYNGGYNFVAFQWYKDGAEILGETYSYLYLKDDELSMGSEYSVMLTDDQGRQILSCPIIATRRPDDAGIYPTMLVSGQHVRVRMPAAVSGEVELYNTMGICMLRQPLAGGDNSIEMSLPTGVYLMRIVRNDDKSPTTSHIIIR